MSKQYDTPLTGIVGVVGRDPETKMTSKGEIVKFSVAVSDGFGDGATTTWFNVAVFNEGLQETILRGDNNRPTVQKGSHVAVQGTVSQKGDYGPDMLAVRVGLIEWLRRAQVVQQAAPQDDEDAF